ncbi:FxSxx-COOH system tetratricopeptide repeat protein [Nonomuraea pusilla]|uniref:Tetratricopeptide repeat-containing protein n=1 Tax=Nonomuraea pusilla TaxID=46177 RepID=A0A1H7RYQ4_9ACTN|nr:FxSxx-COOH system tetratricopeptide repeat protein [Nonomuraea pusilla]SEL65236.1 Tetratricopeptide repeat-containing protein [Nonomuraea pusilla]
MSENSHSMAAREPKVWERVPSRNPNFTGRRDLLDALRKSVNTVTAVVAQPQALQGLGGVGKTQLAIEYAWQYRSHYDLVWWIPADQPLLVPETLAAMAPALNLPPAATTGVGQATQAVLRALQSGVPYRKWLIIFDNAEEPEYIKDFIPRGPGHVLITSRNSRWGDYESTIEVDVFRREESVVFLRKRLGREISDAEADLLAESLGDLPIALEQAAALQRRTLMSVEEYIRLLGEQTSELLALEKAPMYPQSMTAAWRLSVTQLEDRIPEAIEVLRCCAFFGPEPIPRDVFRRGNKSVSQRLAPILSDSILLTKILSTLERFALIKVEPSTRTLQVHRLNQALLRSELSEEERLELSHDVHVLLADGGPSNPDDTASWAAFEELAPHLEPSGLIECTQPKVREFALNLVRYLYVRGNFQPAQVLLGKYIETWTRASGERHPDVLVAHVHLGNIYLALSQYDKAHEVMAEALRKTRESLGPEHSETLWAANSYSTALRARGLFAEAREVDEVSREANLRVYGENDVRTLRVRNVLALDYALNSDYVNARKMHQAAFSVMSQARSGIAKNFLLTSWINLSQVARLGGQVEEAADVSKEAFSYGVKELGPDHRATLLAAKDYAISLRRSGEVAEALELMRDTHARLERLYGDAHADTMAAAIGLSNALRAAGEVEEAMRVAERALHHYPDVFGDDHPFTHACQINLALLTRLSGDPARARQIDETVHARLVEQFGPLHDYAITCAINLQNDLAALGDHEAARRLGEETHAHARQAFSPHHYLSLVCAANLSQDLQATGAEEEGKRLHAETVRRLEFELGPEHPETLAALAGERLNCDFDPSPI